MYQQQNIPKLHRDHEHSSSPTFVTAEYPLALDAMPAVVLPLPELRFVDFHNLANAAKLFRIIEQVRKHHFTAKGSPVNKRAIGDELKFASNNVQRNFLHPQVRKSENLKDAQVRMLEERPLPELLRVTTLHALRLRILPNLVRAMPSPSVRPTYTQNFALRTLFFTHNSPTMQLTSPSPRRASCHSCISGTSQSQGPTSTYAAVPKAYAHLYTTRAAESGLTSAQNHSSQPLNDSISDRMPLINHKGKIENREV
jgi:hypothetical protein